MMDTLSIDVVLFCMSGNIVMVTLDIYSRVLVMHYFMDFLVLLFKCVFHELLIW